jgi:molecular chaperone GrpE
MPEPAPPGVSGDAAGRHPEVLTPESIEAVLAEFRSWLTQAISSPLPAGGSADGDRVPAPEPIDLHTLLGQFVALRHEVNLQTRAVRAQQEQNGEALQQLGQALQALRQAQSAGEQLGQQAEEERLRPLLKALVDLYDALAPAERQVERVSQALLPELDALAAAPETPAHPPSFWARLFGKRSAPASGPGDPERQRWARQAADRVRGLLDSVLAGYGMSLRRLERALQQQGLEPIPTVGRPYDPEQMEVVEVVSDSGRPAGDVVEEVHRGYLWRGRVFRYAQVRVAKP